MREVWRTAEETQEARRSAGGPGGARGNPVESREVRGSRWVAARGREGPESGEARGEAGEAREAPRDLGESPGGPGVSGDPEDSLGA